MRQSILTKFIAPTNTRVSRVKAVQSGWESDGVRRCASVTLEWDYALNANQNHIAAAEILAAQLGWRGRFVMASLGAQSKFAFVFAWDDGDGFKL